MRAWWKRSTPQDDASTVEELVQRASTGKLSRRRFMLALTAMGASTTAVATLVAVSRQVGRQTHAVAPAVPQTAPQQNVIQLHQQNLAQRLTAPQTPTPTPGSDVDPAIAAYVDRLMSNYHPDAVVEDVLASAPAIGHAAIRQRKLDEALGIRGLNIETVGQFAHGDQVVAEWVATGKHTGTFLGYAASGQEFNIRGLTVMTWRDGKIVKESLYYDVNEVRRQLKLE